MQLPPLSLYVHIPWCVRKCPYCDFNSHAISSNTSMDNTLPESSYIDRLLHDFVQEKPNIQNRILQSIFIGGGTPSLFSPASIGRLLNNLAGHVRFSPEIEITMEANPSTFEQKKFTGFRQAGINRLSIGIQSFQDHQLKKLGRIHGREESLNTVAVARKSGFENINLDLMHGLPSQSIHQAMDDLKTAVDFQPEHISWYQLTIEPNTVFYSYPPKLPADDALWAIQDQGMQYLQKSGFINYEISAWSQPGKVSQHNLNYWQFGDYIGIGAGAHGKITHAKTQSIIRSRKTRMPSAYLTTTNNITAEKKTLQSNEIPLEFFLNTLRLKEGVDIGTFTERTGQPISTVTESLKLAQEKGWMTKNNNRLQPTGVGQFFLNDLLMCFMDGSR